MQNIEEQLNEQGALNPKPAKKQKLSLRSILREVLSAKEKALAKKVIEFLVHSLLVNRKIENPQIAKLIMEHIDGKPTQTIIEMAAPDDVFANKTPEELLEIIGLHFVDKESGTIRPKEVKKKKKKRKKAKKAKTKKKTRRAGKKRTKKKQEPLVDPGDNLF